MKSHISLRTFLVAVAVALLSPLVHAAGGLSCEEAYAAPYDFTATYPNLAETYQQVLAHADPTSDHPQLSIVIPAYKEALRLPDSIRKIKAFFDQYPLNVKIHIMIEKSPDNTVEVAQAAAGNDPRFEVVDNQIQRGKGYAVRSGMKRAQGDIQLFMDADLSTPLPEIFNFMNYFYQNPGVSVVIGDRKSSQSQVANKSLMRKAMSKGFNSLTRMVSGLDIDDTQCGFKAFRRDVGQRIFALQTMDRFAFDVEVLVLANELGYSISALPVQWIDDKRSTVNPILDPIKMAYDIAQIRRQVDRNLEAQGISH